MILSSRDQWSIAEWSMYQRSIYEWSVCQWSIYQCSVYLSIYLCIHVYVHLAVHLYIHVPPFGYFDCCHISDMFAFLFYSSSDFPPLADQSCQRKCSACLFQMLSGRVVGHGKCLVSSAIFLGFLCSHIVAFHDFFDCFSFTPEISGQLAMQSQEAKLVLSTPYSMGAAVLSLVASLVTRVFTVHRRIFHQMRLWHESSPSTETYSLASVSGAHFNPAVTLAVKSSDWMRSMINT